MEDDFNVVAEAMVYYGPVQEAYGVPFSFKEMLNDKLLLVKATRSGLPYRLFKTISTWLPFDEEQWSELLNISAKSMQRYRLSGDHVFKPIHAEKIFALAEVAQVGQAVFGSRQRFHLWLQTPSLALGGMSPAYLLQDNFGKELVLAELTRIEHGIFA